MGKIILANMAPARLAALLDRIDYAKWTERTIGSRADFEVELERTRQRGFGVTDQEMIDGLRAVASPIFDHHGTPIAALSVALPVHACSLDELMNVIGPRVIAAGKIVSAVFERVK
jgi:DNA-binding IclR family transcriptional regulator